MEQSTFMSIVRGMLDSRQVTRKSTLQAREDEAKLADLRQFEQEEEARRAEVKFNLS